MSEGEIFWVFGLWFLFFLGCLLGFALLGLALRRPHR